MKCANKDCDYEITDGRCTQCSKCKKNYCFDNPNFNNKCGGYKQLSWGTFGEKRKKEVKCPECKEAQKNPSSTLTLKTKSNKKDQVQDSKSELSEILATLRRMETTTNEVREEQRDLQDSIEFLS